MVSIASLPSLATLTFHYDNDDGKYWIPVSAWTEFLRLNLFQTDKWDDVDSSNIRRIFKRYNNGVQVRDGKLWTTFSIILSFVFNHRDNLLICKTITGEVEVTLLENKRALESELPVQNVLELYKLIAKNNFRDKQIQDLTLTDATFQITKIPTLVVDHKVHFSESEWAKICLFEWHFSQDNSFLELTYECQLKERYNFYLQCQEVKKIAEKIKTQAKEIVHTNVIRRDYAETVYDVHIYGKLTHNPITLDAAIFDAVKETLDVSNLLTVGCSVECTHDAGLHVLLEITDNNADINDKIEIAIFQIKDISEQHGEQCRDVTIFKKEAFSKFKSKDSDTIQRFHLQVSVINGSLDSEKIHHVTIQNTENVDDHETCQICFSDCEQPPLHWKDFNITQEWLFYVPLFLQIVLEAFVNKTSLQRSSDKLGYLMPKIVCLYSIFERLLNLQNRHYLGVLQEVNTDELAFNFHSVGTVFSITSQTGITQSLKAAERRLKLYSNPDLCYFNTYLRRYALKYESVAGLKEDKICLQQCYLAFCVDNLVRLSFKQDPERGSSKTMQIATLPMTLKGMPKDVSVSESWHDEDTCDGTDHCPCMQEKRLTKQSLQKVIMEPLENENQIFNQFKEFMTWSWTAIWLHSSCQQKLQDMLAEAVHAQEIIHEADIEDLGYDDDTIELDISMRSLHLENKEDNDVSSDKYSSNESIQTSSSEDDFADTTSESSCYSEFSISSESEKSLSCSDIEASDWLTDNMFMEPENASEISSRNCLESVASSKTETSKEDATPGTHTTSLTESELADISEIAVSIQYEHTYINDTAPPDDMQEETSDTFASTTFGFSIYQPPPMICRHPPPAIGRDDNISKLREVLDDVLVKSGNRFPFAEQKSRILFAPDQKLGNNLLKLLEQDRKYKIFLPEFPLLHLRKSKITNLCTGYKDAGILQLLMYMNDDEKEKDWMKLVDATHIEHATRNIKRLSLTLHLFFLILFLHSLESDMAAEVVSVLKAVNEESVKKWSPLFEVFLQKGIENNATFSLHYDIMSHCDEVLAISAAERIGGPDGYDLLLAAVKSSLPFAFLNGASSYGAFCVKLLVKHYSTGPFFQGLKKCMFSTPHKDSETNIALDQQREMDHRDALKGFRPRGTIESIVPRMSQVDRMSEVRQSRLSIWGKSDRDDTEETRVKYSEDTGICWKLSDKDISHIIPTLQMILRTNDKIMEEDRIPKNVYGACIRPLSDAILDEKTFEIGKFLIVKYVCRSGLLEHTDSDIPVLDDNLGPKELMQKVKKGKGVVVKRATCKTLVTTDIRTVKEKKRRQAVDRMTKVYDCLSSEMNTCQAVIKPDCSKPAVQKSSGIKDALFWCLQQCLRNTVKHSTPLKENTTSDKKKQVEEEKNVKKETTKYLYENRIIIYATTTIPQTITSKLKLAVVEFAGVKFKTFAMTGRQYLEFVETSVINKVLTQFKGVKRLIICEEKYSFTPNDLKGPTREKRPGTQSKTSIFHLKKGAEIISAETFDKRAATRTMTGKSTISTFLAENVPSLKLENVLVDIDSEMVMDGCPCSKSDPKDKCTCNVYTTPVRAEFGAKGYIKQQTLSHIKQRKGEAEMAQVDWLRDCISDLEEGDGVVSYVTSGDIDAVVIHLFALSIHWPRKDDGGFRFPVYVALQKPGREHDLYCITDIICIIEKEYGVYSGLQIAVGLAMGGNDFFPKFYGKSHTRMLQVFIQNQYMQSLLKVTKSDTGVPVSARIDGKVFVNYIKDVYCHKTYDAGNLNFDEVRQSTIKTPGQKQCKNPKQWLPPQSALLQLALLLECQVEYLFTAWYPDREIPNFEAKGCLKTKEDGSIEYNLGDDIKIQKEEEALSMTDGDLKKALNSGKRKISKRSVERLMQETPQKGRRTKRQLLTSTPRFVCFSI